MSKKYPDIPGWKGEAETGRQAALNFIDQALTLREKVLCMVGRCGDIGLAPDEAASRLGCIIGSIRPRFSELKNMGLIKDSGRRRDSDYHNKQIVWVLNDEAKEDIL